MLRRYEAFDVQSAHRQPRIASKHYIEPGGEANAHSKTSINCNLCLDCHSILSLQDSEFYLLCGMHRLEIAAPTDGPSSHQIHVFHSSWMYPMLQETLRALKTLLGLHLSTCKEGSKEQHCKLNHDKRWTSKTKPRRESFLWHQQDNWYMYGINLMFRRIYRK